MWHDYYEDCHYHRSEPIHRVELVNQRRPGLVDK
jgi:hypothetical protein